MIHVDAIHKMICSQIGLIWFASSTHWLSDSIAEFLKRRVHFSLIIWSCCVASEDVIWQRM